MFGNRNESFALVREHINSSVVVRSIDTVVDHSSIIKSLSSCNVYRCNVDICIGAAAGRRSHCSRPAVRSESPEYPLYLLIALFAYVISLICKCV